jgi:phosphomannomutase
MKSLSARSSLSLTARTAAQHQRNQPLDFHCQPRVAGPAGRQRLDYRLTGTFHVVVEMKKIIGRTTTRYSGTANMATFEGRNKRVIALFDVDGTLTAPRADSTPEVKEFMRQLKTKIVVGVVGGSDLVKQQEQLGANITTEVDFSFSENGLVAYRDGALIGKKSINQHLGEENVKRFVNFVLRYIADLDIPIKRGTFIEFRAGMINVSPIGRNCSREERNAYEEFDLANNVRKTMVEVLQREFADLNLTFSVGGQISFDVFPTGWDKTYCLNYIDAAEFDEIHFFGDKTFQGGNDYEIFMHPRVIGHTVTSPDDTMAQCKTLFGL